MINQIMFYTSVIQQNVIDANTQISANAGLPVPGTSTWAAIQKAYNQDLWFIPQPGINGWNGIPQSVLINGVINVNIEPNNNSWYQPIIWPPETE